MDKKFFKNDRTLFYLNMCPVCREWMRFLGILNTKLPLNKQIDFIEVSNYYDFGIIDNPKISVYKKYFNNSFPIFFYEGRKLDESASEDELKAFVNTLIYRDILYHEFLDKELSKFIFTKECEFKRFGFRKRLVCS
jgi:hypothetical protein